MKVVSKTQYKIMQTISRRDEALENIKHAARSGDTKKLNTHAKELADVEIELAAAEQESDLYDCAECGKEFPDGEHVDLLVSAIVCFGNVGTNPKRIDLGYGDPRRVKICGDCHSKWAIKVDDYVEMR